jgi:hypothetical protein
VLGKARKTKIKKQGERTQVRRRVQMFSYSTPSNFEASIKKTDGARSSGGVVIASAPARTGTRRIFMGETGEPLKASKTGTRQCRVTHYRLVGTATEMPIDPWGWLSL